MIVKEIFYGIECNRCRETFMDYNDHSFWMDEDTAIEQATDSEWIAEKGKHYCPDCYDFNEEKDENLPKEDFPEHLKILNKFIDKVAGGVLRKVSESEDEFSVKCRFYKKSKLDDFEENYIKQLISENFLSLEYEQLDRYKGQQCIIKLKK